MKQAGRGGGKDIEGEKVDVKKPSKYRHGIQNANLSLPWKGEDQKTHELR